jgi:hypothetical protein
MNHMREWDWDLFLDLVLDEQQGMVKEGFITEEEVKV